MLTNFPLELFEEPHALQVLAPEESIFSENTDDLRIRFAQSDDSELASLAADMAQENVWLNHLISKSKLASWVEAIRLLVQEDIKAEECHSEEYP